MSHATSRPIGQNMVATVAMFGLLHSLRRAQGLPTTVALEVPAAGIDARAIARELGLPEERIDGIFFNHVPAGLATRVRPGDRIAFVPVGTPASHPAFFGAFDAHARS
jgi:hypothetical protein